ncbi:hypothetical protein ACU6QD_07065 [Corynebacterium glucuronolyticum]
MLVDDVVDAQFLVLAVEDLLEPGVAVGGEDLVKVVNVIPNVLFGDGLREVNADDEDTVVCGDRPSSTYSRARMAMVSRSPSMSTILGESNGPMNDT